MDHTANTEGMEAQRIKSMRERRTMLKGMNEDFPLVNSTLS